MMAEPLNPMKRFLGKSLLCGFLAVFPITVLEAMWSDPGMREFVRMVDGSAAMWIAFSIYLFSLILFWSRWVTRPETRKK